MLVAGVAADKKKKKEMCILCNPGRSIKLEAVRERFLIDLLKFCFALNHASGGGTCVRGCRGGARLLFLWVFVCLAKCSLQTSVRL